MDISVIVPNFNGQNLLGKNIPKLVEVLLDFIERNNKKIEIIITDDNSADSSVEVTRKIINKYSNDELKLELVESSVNSGFSGNVNRGVEKAKGEILLLLNTDVIPKIGFLDPLLAHFKDPKLFAVACMDESIEGDKIELRGRGVGKWSRGFLLHSRGLLNENNTLWVSGGSGAFRKSVWDKLGGLNEVFNPFYWEDIDLSYRARKSGYETLFEKKSVVVHEHESGTIKSRFSPFDVKKIAYRNQFIFVWENATDLNIVLSHFMWLPYYFIRAVINADLAFFLGFFGTFNLIPKIVKSRSKNKKLFVKTDIEVVAPFKE